MMVDLFPPCRAGDVMLRLCNLSFNGRRDRWDALVDELSISAGPLMAKAALEMALPAGREADLDEARSTNAAVNRARKIIRAFYDAGETVLQ